jgi:hypothetical protein
MVSRAFMRLQRDGDESSAAEHYRVAWTEEGGAGGGGAHINRGAWRPTQHAAILDAVDLFWREQSLQRIDIFCEAERVSTLHRDDPRISATLAALEHAVRNIYDADSA